MKILFDQGVPLPLKQFLSSHDVETAFGRGWDKISNGQLLNEAEKENFDVLVTTDQNLKYQQNLETRKIAIVVLLSTSWPRIKLHIERITSTIDEATSRSYFEISIQ